MPDRSPPRRESPPAQRLPVRLGRQRRDTVRRMTYDVIVIGAGVSGLYQLHRLRERALHYTSTRRATTLAACGTGTATPAPGSTRRATATWYRSRPSCSPSGTGPSTSRRSPRRCATCGTSSTASTCACRHHVRCARSEADTFDTSTRQWTVGSTTVPRRRPGSSSWRWGSSSPNLPTFPGVDDFEGPSFHTSSWPSDGMDLTGKRVRVVGTGVMAGAAHPRGGQGGRSPHRVPADSELGVPARCTTARSRRKSKPRSGRRRPRLRAGARRPSAASSTTPIGGRRSRVSDEVREAFDEELYGDQPGFGIWMGNFR